MIPACGGWTGGGPALSQTSRLKGGAVQTKRVAMASLRRTMKRSPNFCGTKLPILMKTKGRGETDRGTKLPLGHGTGDELMGDDEAIVGWVEAIVTKTEGRKAARPHPQARGTKTDEAGACGRVS